MDEQNAFLQPPPVRLSTAARPRIAGPSFSRSRSPPRPSRPMRVLLLNYEFPPVGGGAGHATANIASGLVRMGIEAEVLTSRIDGEPDGSIVDGVPVHRVSSWRVDIHDCGLRGASTYVLAAAAKLRRLRRERHYDLEHYFFSLPTGLLTLVPQVQRTPYVLSLRGSDVPGYDRYNKRVERLHSVL